MKGYIKKIENSENTIHITLIIGLFSGCDQRDSIENKKARSFHIGECNITQEEKKDE